MNLNTISYPALVIEPKPPAKLANALTSTPRTLQTTRAGISKSIPVFTDAVIILLFAVHDYLIEQNCIDLYCEYCTQKDSVAHTADKSVFRIEPRLDSLTASCSIRRFARHAVIRVSGSSEAGSGSIIGVVRSTPRKLGEDN